VVKPAEELGGSDVYSIAQDLIAKVDVERDDTDQPLLAPGVLCCP
jgi:hypothetical protein